MSSLDIVAFADVPSIIVVFSGKTNVAVVPRYLNLLNTKGQFVVRMAVVLGLKQQRLAVPLQV